MSEQIENTDEIESGAENAYLEMSDEDFLKAEVPVFQDEQPATDKPRDATGRFVSQAEKKPEQEEADEGEEEGEAKDGEADAEGADDEAGDSPAEKEAADAEGQEEKEEKQESEAKDPDLEKKDPEAKEPKEEKDVAKEPAKVDYEAEYKRILSPIRANGRDIQVESVDDAIALMQMGANYNKKMAALKPNLKLLKVLENNGLLSEEKIGFLIDLSRKDQGAINKLVNEAGIDPMDLDAEKAKAYKQTAYAVDDREIELDTVLDELKEAPSYTRTLDVVSNKWDVASKQVISQQPQLLKVIEGHITSGIYDLISKGVERERMLGRLNGLSDLEAYRQVGDVLNAQGKFNHLVQPQGKPVAKEPEVVQPKPKKVEDDTLKDKRRAASSTRTAAPSSTPKDFNPLAMSDEEFSKLANPKFV